MVFSASSGEVTLSCLSLGGTRRYDLPARPAGRTLGYELFWRPSPAMVIHHLKRVSFFLPHPEIFLISVEAGHCISIAIDADGIPDHAYVNINLPARQTKQGWSWEDLEVDVKVVRDYRGRWMPIVVDLAAFDEAEFSQKTRWYAIHELEAILGRIASGAFPFAVSRATGIGFDPALVGQILKRTG
jgi:Protein of unknown function (DUF402)